MAASTGASGPAREDGRTGANGPVNGSARGNGSKDGAANDYASALERPWAGLPPAARLTDADDAAIEENLRLASGGATPLLAWQTLRELAAAALGAGGTGADIADGAVAAPEGATERGLPVFAAIEAAMALAPRDPLEGLLAAQMSAVHTAAMRCLCRAAECAGHPRIEALYLGLAARLLNLFVRQAEALDRRAVKFDAPAGQGEGAGGAAYGAAGYAGYGACRAECDAGVGEGTSRATTAEAAEARDIPERAGDAVRAETCAPDSENGSACEGDSGGGSAIPRPRRSSGP